MMRKSTGNEGVGLTFQSSPPASRKLMLELCSGSGVMAAAFEKEGYLTLTIDLNTEADWKIDLLKVSPRMILERFGRPNVIWAGVPCNDFSIAAVHHNWKDGTLQKDSGIKLLFHALMLISALKPDRWYIENPMGMMRTLPMMRYLPRKTLTQCQYGHKIMKPTDVWTNDGLWMPKKCRNGMTCHEKAPRSSKNSGLQGLDKADRAVYPQALCEEVAKR